jgi:hypothetical protein
VGVPGWGVEIGSWWRRVVARVRRPGVVSVWHAERDERLVVRPVGGGRHRRPE